MARLVLDQARLARTELERGSGAGRIFPGGRLTTCLIPHVPQQLPKEHLPTTAIGHRPLDRARPEAPWAWRPCGRWCSTCASIYNEPPVLARKAFAPHQLRPRCALPAGPAQHGVRFRLASTSRRTVWSQRHPLALLSGVL